MQTPKLFWSDKYLYKLPKGHRFPIEKYELVKEQLIHEGTITEHNLYDPGLVEEEIILLTHTKSYWNSLKNLSLPLKEMRKIGLPVTEMSVNRARNSVAGTISSATEALSYGIGMNLAGGTHHAYADRGEGFCILNDIAIAANYLLKENVVNRILIIDLDVHQGNGTASMFKDVKNVITFSMHGENNYPLFKEKSDLDVPLPSGINDEQYLTILYGHVPNLVELAQPDLIFYQAGVDILQHDRLGKLGLTKAGCRKRDEFIIDTCYKSQIPLVITMGGGYNLLLRDLIDAHCNTFRAAIDVFFI